MYSAYMKSNYKLERDCLQAAQNIKIEKNIHVDSQTGD